MLNQLERETQQNKIQTNNKSKIRSSNFELLRIIAMFMIIIFHITVHVIINQLTDLDSIGRMNNGWFCHPIWYKKMLLVELIMPFGQVGNAIFMIIAGYFGIEKDNDIKRIGKIGKKLIFQMLFSTIWLVLYSAFFYHFCKSNYIELIDLNSVNSDSWFVGYYFLVVFISYLFLNKYLNKFTKQQYLAFLVILFSIMSFSWTRDLMNGLTKELDTLCTGVFLFSLGGYIKKYNPFKNINVFVFIGIIVITNIFICISFHNTVMSNIGKYIISGSTKKYTYNIPQFERNSCIAIIIATCMFEVFKRLKIRNSKIINFIGASTFMIYLIHENNFFHSLWRITDWITLLYNNPYAFIGELLLKTLYAFGFGLIAYTIYIVIKEIIKKIRKRKYNTIL